jgi:hypothetical protein
MRVTVSHNKGLQGAIKIVNDSVEQLVASAASGPVTISDVEKRWEGSTMHFSFRGKMGFFSSSVKGFVECYEKEVTVEVELPGALKSLVPEEKVKAQVEGRVRGLLNA